MGGHIRPNQFESYQVLHFAVARFIHSAHAAFTEELQNLVASAEHIAWRQLVSFRECCGVSRLRGRRGRVYKRYIVVQSILLTRTIRWFDFGRSLVRTWEIPA